MPQNNNSSQENSTSGIGGDFLVLISFYIVVSLVGIISIAFYGVSRDDGSGHEPPTKSHLASATPGKSTGTPTAAALGTVAKIPSATHTEKTARAPQLLKLTPEEGEEVFNINCSACHQMGAQGKVGFAPSIRNRDFLALASDDFIRNTIRAGRPGTSMVGRPDLTDAQINGIIAYLRSLPVKTKLEVTVDPNKKYPGDALHGKPLYELYCASCHGPKGEGYSVGGSGPGIGLAGFLNVASDDFIFQTMKHGRIGTPMRSFIGSKGLANLTEKDAGHIIAYLRSLNITNPSGNTEMVKAGDPAKGEQHYNINCSACHQIGGVGRIGFAPSIRNRDFLAIASDDFIRDTIKNGRPGTTMVARPDLSAQTVEDIIAYLRALPVKVPLEVTVDPDKKLTGNHANGEYLYNTYCNYCHGPEGTGYIAGGSGPAIGTKGFLDAASDDFIFQTLKYGRIGTPMKSFIGAAGLANLTNNEAYDIIAYLRTLQK